MTTAYHLQTNGLTERLDRTLADMISMCVDVEHKNWDDILPYVTLVYNMARQETTQKVPFSLVYGHDVTTTLDPMLPYENETHETEVTVFTQRAEKARQLAPLWIIDQQDSDARHYNIRHRPVTYNVGDKVCVWTLIHHHGLSEKLLRRYFRPSKVLQRISEVNHEVISDGSQSSKRGSRQKFFTCFR